MDILFCRNRFRKNIEENLNGNGQIRLDLSLNLKKYPAVAALIVALFLDYLGSHAIQSNWSYFTAYRFQWTPKTIGISLAVVGILVSFVQGVV